MVKVFKLQHAHRPKLTWLLAHQENTLSTGLPPAHHLSCKRAYSGPIQSRTHAELGTDYHGEFSARVGISAQAVDVLKRGVYNLNKKGSYFNTHFVFNFLFKLFSFPYVNRTGGQKFLHVISPLLWAQSNIQKAHSTSLPMILA